MSLLRAQTGTTRASSSGVSHSSAFSCQHIAVVQSLSHIWHFATPWIAACQASLSFTICWSYLLEFVQTQVHWVGDAIQPSHPLSSFSPLPSIFPSIRVFSNEWALYIRRSKYWSFSFNISPSNESSSWLICQLSGINQRQLLTSSWNYQINCKGFMPKKFLFNI